MVATRPVPAARKRGRPTAVERLERRGQILDAALPVFLQYGFGGATVDQLAAAAQVTKRTVYSYFGDKAGLFAAMVGLLATTVSRESPDDDTLFTLAQRIVFRLYSPELVGLHRLVIAESSRFPELAVTLHTNGDARHISRLREHIAAEQGIREAELAPVLFSILLGESHRQRLLGLSEAPSLERAGEMAADALGALGMASSVPAPGALIPPNSFQPAD